MNNNLKHESEDEELEKEDEEVEEEELEEEELEELEEIEEIDKETRGIIFRAMNKTFDFGEIDDNKNIKNKKSKPKKENNTLSLEAFTRVINNNQSNKTKDSTKKFVSKRADDKKKELGMDENVGPKRQFNARLPPYNYIHNDAFNIKDIKLDSNKEFPLLKNIEI